MMHPRYESDGASITASSSSSPVSPKINVYYVQSPSSHSDRDKSSLQATPSFNSPADSPSHLSAFDRTSRFSSPSSSRVSGSWRWATRGNRRRSGKGWQGFNAIDEEAVYYDVHDEGYSTRFKCFLGVLVLGAVFGLFCLIIWGASRPYKPHINMKSLKVHNFYYGLGADRTGVPTQLLTLNCSISMAIRNPATFFGIHVGADPVDLIYLELPVATGQLKNYYQPRQSERMLTVHLGGDGVPLYGAGDNFVGVLIHNGSIPMKMNFKLQTQGYVVGLLVQTYHRIRIFCKLTVDFRSMEEVEFNGDSCTIE